MKELPSSEDIERAQTATKEEVADLVNIPSKEGDFVGEEIRLVFDEALHKLKAEGWSVIIDTSSKASISVDQEHKAIKIPESKKLAYTKLVSLIAHEVGTHVARRLNGERSRLKLLGLGLDRYEQGEEGVATMREQVMDSTVKEFAGLEGHLAISLAQGLDGTPRNFREVYRILEKYFELRALLAGKKPEEAVVEAQANAWNRAVRTFRGTDCQTPGVCFTKDIIYREGNMAVWDVVKNNPNELIRFSIGKYDPSNERHLWILEQLGINDEDLNQK